MIDDIGFLYFARCLPAFVKVGFSVRSPLRRLTQINGVGVVRAKVPERAEMGSLRFVGAMIATRQMESDWHRRHKHLSAVACAPCGRSEWYWDTAELRSEMDSLGLLGPGQFTHSTRPGDIGRNK